MVTIEPQQLHHVLCLVDHRGATREHDLYGGPLGQRMLNVTGRWAAAGTQAAPLLTWPTAQDAEADAAKAAAARGRAVEVRQAGGNSMTLHTAPFGAQHAAALLGYLPYATAAARQLEADRKKLMGYAAVMLAGANAGSVADPAVAVDSMKAAARNLRLAGIGSGSWVSAAQGLTGARAHDVAVSVLDGELECDPGISPEDIVKAIAIAHALAPKPKV